jgi:hypothetical protein
MRLGMVKSPPMTNNEQKPLRTRKAAEEITALSIMQIAAIAACVAGAVYAVAFVVAVMSNDTPQ